MLEFAMAHLAAATFGIMFLFALIYDILMLLGRRLAVAIRGWLPKEGEEDGE